MIFGRFVYKYQTSFDVTLELFPGVTQIGTITYFLASLECACEVVMYEELSQYTLPKNNFTRIQYRVPANFIRMLVVG